MSGQIVAVQAGVRGEGESFVMPAVYHNSTLACRAGETSPPSSGGRTLGKIGSG